MTSKFYAAGLPNVVRLLRAAAGWLFPIPCLGCGTPLGGGERLHLCATCTSHLAPPEPSASAATCRALWSYRPPLDAVIRALKFGRLDYLGGHLAAALADHFADEIGSIDLVAHVPLHWTRRLGRGYDQAERIAAPLAKRLGVAHAGALARRRPTRRQARLGRAQRLDNPQDAFRVRSGISVADRRILLVDDVTTTGSTLRAAMAALARAGAGEVVALAVAQTPAPGALGKDPSGT